MTGEHDEPKSPANPPWFLQTDGSTQPGADGAIFGLPKGGNTSLLACLRRAPLRISSTGESI